MLARLSRAPRRIALPSHRGRATGVGSELALASDMRFASREKAIRRNGSRRRPGPGGGPMARLPRLIGRGRALEVLLGADDIGGELAERYGYVNRCAARFRARRLRRLRSTRRIASASTSRPSNLPWAPASLRARAIRARIVAASRRRARVGRDALGNGRSRSRGLPADPPAETPRRRRVEFGAAEDRVHLRLIPTASRKRRNER